MRLQSALHRSESLPALSATLLSGLLGARGGSSGEAWRLQPQFQPQRSATHNVGPSGMSPLRISHAAKGRLIAPPTAVVPPFLGHNALFYSSLTRSSDHGRRGVDSARSG